MKATRSMFYSLLMSAILVGCSGDVDGISSESSRQPKWNANSNIVVEEYADLQCPACKAAHEQIVPSLEREFGSKVRYEFNHFPIRSAHRYALEAALAAECVADQGKFWEFLDITFERQNEMTVDVIRSWASELNLDMQLFEKCWDSQVKKDTVLADYKEGRDRGVTGTPTFYVNGQKVPSTLNALTQAIRDAIDANTQRL